MFERLRGLYTDFLSAVHTIVYIGFVFSIAVLAGHIWGAFKEAFYNSLIFFAFLFLQTVVDWLEEEFSKKSSPVWLAIFWKAVKILTLIVLTSLAVVVILATLREGYFLITTPCKH